MMDVCRPLLAACLLAITACSASSTATGPVQSRAHPPWDSSPVQTDSLEYTLVRRQSEFRAFVSATYRNTTGAPVYYARCGRGYDTPMFSIGRTGPDSTRRFFVDWGWACVGGVPTGTLQPGENVTVVAPFGSVDQPFMQPPLQPEELVGTFRVVLSLCVQPVSESAFCESSPFAARMSNAFTVHY